MTGNPGTGKSHIAIALGIKACEEGYKVLYTTIPLLITELKESKDANKLRETLRINGEEFDYLKGVNANETRETA